MAGWAGRRKRRCGRKGAEEADRECAPHLASPHGGEDVDGGGACGRWRRRCRRQTGGGGGARARAAADTPEGEKAGGACACVEAGADGLEVRLPRADRHQRQAPPRRVAQRGRRAVERRAKAVDDRHASLLGRRVHSVRRGTQAVVKEHGALGRLSWNRAANDGGRVRPAGNRRGERHAAAPAQHRGMHVVAGGAAHAQEPAGLQRIGGQLRPQREQPWGDAR